MHVLRETSLWILVVWNVHCVTKLVVPDASKDQGWLNSQVHTIQEEHIFLDCMTKKATRHFWTLQTTNPMTQHHNPQKCCPVLLGLLLFLCWQAWEDTHKTTATASLSLVYSSTAFYFWRTASKNLVHDSHLEPKRGRDYEMMCNGYRFRDGKYLHTLYQSRVTGHDWLIDWLTNWNWKVLWHRNECGKNKSNENFKTTNPSHNKDRPKTTAECEMF
jgi:hypothetical protein